MKISQKTYPKGFFKFPGDIFRLVIKWETRKTFSRHVKYTMVYKNVMKIIPVKPNEILKKDG